jgi:DNA-binding transcriptional LysR family regulator
MDLDDLSAFAAVVKAGGFRGAAKATAGSASKLSEAVRRLEARLGVRLLNRTTCSVAPTEAGARLLERLLPALGEVEAAPDVVNAFRDRPAGTLRLNVPANVARTILPAIVSPFLKAYPEIRLEVTVEDGFVDVLAAGCDAGIRYGERLEQDMIAIPIGPRTQRFVTAAAPAYLAARGTPGIRATCSIMPACAVASRAGRWRSGSSRRMARRSSSIQKGNCWSSRG